MTKYFLKWIFTCSIMLVACTVFAESKEFSFGVIAYPFAVSSDESLLRIVMSDADDDNVAFVVVNGVKASNEPCSDVLYTQRKVLLNNSKNGLILLLTDSDWASCKNEHGKSAAIGRLNRLRELFFIDDFSMGATKIPLVRQSAAAKFRSYGENARWEIGDILFSTINLPKNNNHYLSDAGRNSEFEDRLVANRDWLHRLFIYAARRKLNGIVLFCEGNPFSKPVQSDIRRDGFSEIRQQLIALASNFPGKVLIVHGQQEAKQTSSAKRNQKGNITIVEGESPWIKIKVVPSLPQVFFIEEPVNKVTNASQNITQ